MEQIFVDPIFTNPGEVIPIIKALADPTRLGMLLTMNSFAPKGCTASQLADNLSKKIPTILHHLEMLQDLGLADYKMEKNEAGREIKHWIVINPKFNLKIDLEEYPKYLRFYGDKLSDYSKLNQFIMFLFEEEKIKKRTITNDFINSNPPKEIQKKINSYIRSVKSTSHTEIDNFQAQEIYNQLTTQEKLEKYLRRWILKAFKDSAGILQLDFFEIGREFNLDTNLRQSLFEYFMRSSMFEIRAYTESGQPVQRIVLKEEFIDEIDL